MRRVKFYLSVGIVGADREETVEFDDDTTDEEIDEHLQAWLGNFDSGWYEESFNHE